MAKRFLIFALLFFVSGCATTVKKDYTKFMSANPRSILIVPVVNETVDIDAPDYFLSTISVPVSEQGYYVFPVHMVKRVLEDDGLSDADLVHSASTEKLCELFGSDAVLYIKIKRWDAQYALIATTVTVGLEYIIKDGKTGVVLWQEDSVVRYTSQGAGSGNLLADVIIVAVNAAMTKAAPNYIPLAKQANEQVFVYPGPGIPPGPYKK